MPLYIQNRLFLIQELHLWTQFPTSKHYCVIPVLEVHELLNKIHDILDSAVSKQAGNTAHI